MFGLENYDDAKYDEKYQIDSFLSLGHVESGERKIDSGLADLIDQAADKGMRGNKLNKLISKIDEIKSLMDEIKQVMEMDDSLTTSVVHGPR